jgi:DNA-binding CsgD family transcriptional regulator
MSDARFTRLTPRQAECLRLLARPMRPKEIALALGLSVRTVEGYIAEAVERLEAGSSLAAARMFADWEQSQARQAPPGNLPGQENRVEEPTPDASPEPLSDTVIDTVPAATGRQIDLSSWHRNAIIFALTIGIIVSVLLLVAGGEGIARLRTGWVASHPNTHR